MIWKRNHQKTADLPKHSAYAFWTGRESGTPATPIPNPAPDRIYADALTSERNRKLIDRVPSLTRIHIGISEIEFLFPFGKHREKYQSPARPVRLEFTPTLSGRGRA